MNSTPLHSALTPSQDLKAFAIELILSLDNINEQKNTLDQVPQSQVSETVKFSFLQKTKHWQSLRKKLKAQLKILLEEDIRQSAKEEGVSETGFISGTLGVKYFRSILDSVNLEKTERSELLIKNLSLELLSERLRANKNFNPYLWGLKTDDIHKMEEKIRAVANKVSPE